MRSLTTAPKLVNDLENYELRETILLAGTIGLNGFLSIGSKGIGQAIILNMRFRLFMIFPMGRLAILFPKMDAT